MAKFIIKQINPFNYKNNIYAFWDNYLPGTSNDRLEWLQKGNPSGKAQWFFAINEQNDEIAGMISIIPREFHYGKKQLIGGMLGDYMISEKYRVFGPAIQLQKFVKKNYDELGYDFLYTIPDPDLTKFMEGLGYKKLCKLIHFIRSINSKHYIKKYVGSFGARIIAPVIDWGLNKTAIGNYQKTNLVRNEITDIQDFIFSANDYGLIGFRNKEYLVWRYNTNKQFKFNIITYYEAKSNNMVGYLIFINESNKIIIFDIYASTKIKKYYNQILKDFITYSTKLNIEAIYMRLSCNSELIDVQKNFNFFDTKDDAFLMYYSNKNLKFNHSYFTWGDKLI